MTVDGAPSAVDHDHGDDPDRVNTGDHGGPSVDGGELGRGQASIGDHGGRWVEGGELGRCEASIGDHGGRWVDGGELGRCEASIGDRSGPSVDGGELGLGPDSRGLGHHGGPSTVGFDERPDLAAVPGRWAWAEVDLGAIRHNLAWVAEQVAPSSVWAVVKANGYGHGAVPVSRAALDAGAAGLAVALVQEGVELRGAGIDAPILVLSQQPPEQFAEMVIHHLTPVFHDASAVDNFAEQVRSVGHVGVAAHVKVDTGMHRVGAAPDEAPSVIAAVHRAAPWLRLDGVMTHFACADEPDHPLNERQLDVFGEVLRVSPLGVADLHAANSATALANPAARFDRVRLGIALYGIVPGDGVRHLCDGLRPALSLRARVSRVHRVPAGETVSYGARWMAERDTTVAAVPIGYADGVPRRLGLTGGEVLVGGRRRPILGVVTMDQLMVDCGDDDVSVGDPVVLLGEQGGERITADEWAERLGTIPYEIVCGISARVERRYLV